MAVDRLEVIKNLLYIDNKERVVVPFEFNRLQRYFHRHKTNRNIILKHRQGGCTSSVLADMFIDCITIPHTPCAVVSHETKATQRLLDRVQFYYDTMDDPRPEIGAESRSEKKFPETHSSIYIGTAGARAFGRGDTIHRVLLSELAHYESPETILNGIEDSVPAAGEITIECTPNGENNLFFDLWVRAKEGKSPYKPFFFPWWWSEDYYFPLNSPLALPDDRGELHYNREEQELVDKFHLSEEQMRWRRWKISEKLGLFWQEFPEDEVSCFIAIGDPVFDPEVLAELTQDCYDGERHPQGWTFWRKPDKRRSYIVGADTSAGVPGGSYSAAVVLDDKWQVCATYQARVEPHTFAGILQQLGMWYNKALMVVERNFTGYAVLGHLLKYPHMYFQRDFTTGKVSEQRGWWTNDQTKEHMRTVTKSVLTHEEGRKEIVKGRLVKSKTANLKLWDVNLIRQLRGYRYIKMKATAETHDDMAIALMIACAVKKSAIGARGFMGVIKGWNW